MKYLLLLLLPCWTEAATYLNWGFGFDRADRGSYSDVQNYAFGLRLSNMFYVEGGGWKDSTDYIGAEGSLYTSAGLVLNLDLTEKYVSYSIGPAFITRPDTLLGSHYQVYHKLSIGFRENSKRIGLFVKHFSNAGAFGARNAGRNFFGLEIGF